MQFNCISEEGAADRGFAVITSVFETGCMAHGHGPSLVLQFLSLRPAVVCAVLVTLGLGLHSWHTGWFGESGSSVSPPSQVVRLHGFPSPESQRILGALEELFSAACKQHPSCTEAVADAGDQKLHALRYHTKGADSVLIYYTAKDQDGLTQLLHKCTKAQQAESAAEGGSGYRCFQGSPAQPISLEELNGVHYLSLQELGVEEASTTAPRKQVFISADPRVEAARAALQQCDWDAELDRKLQVVRNTFRVTLEWMGWQQQALHRASQVDEVLVAHVVDFNSSAVESLRQVADFVGVGRRMADLKAAATGLHGMDSPNVTSLASQLPEGILADVIGFAHETLQEPRFMEPYVDDKQQTMAVRGTLWPPPEQLSRLASDNTILVTMATCGGVALAANWIRTVQALQVPCYMVVALDASAYKALEALAPGHIVQVVEPLPAEPSYATPGTKQMRQVTAQIPQIISAILEQGYNVAWSEADVVWLANPFERFFKWHDLVGVYDSAGMPEIGGLSPPGERYLEKHPLSTGFLFMRQNPRTKALLAAWASRMTASHPEEHGAAFQHALRGDLAKQMDLAVLPMPAFPSAAQQLPDLGASAQVREAFQEAWQAEPPAWLHPSTAQTLGDKMALLKREHHWKLEDGFSPPSCAAL